MNRHTRAIRRFVAARHRGRLAGILGNKLWTVSLLFIAVSTVLHLLFALFPFTFFPMLWDVTAAAALLWAVIAGCDTLLFRRPTLLSTARGLERTAGDGVPHPLLSIALELSADANQTALHDEAYERAAGQVALYSSTTLRRRHPRRLAATLVIAAVSSVSLFNVRPLLCSYWSLPLQSIKGNPFTVFPGTVHVPRNSSVTLRLLPGRAAVPSCRVEITDLERNIRQNRRLSPDSLGSFGTRLDSVESSFTYTFFYGRIRCAAETVTVVQPPLIGAIQVRLFPPSSTGQPPRDLPEGQADFTVYSGTRAHIAITSSPLFRADLLYGNDTVPLVLNGSSASCTLTVTTDGSYTFSLVDTFLQKSDSLASYSIGILPDDTPTVRFLRPGFNKPLEPAQQETLLVEASDDLGIRSLTLLYCKPDEFAAPASQDLSPGTPSPLVQKQFIWKLSRLSLYPGDTLFYWARARDTRSPGTAQVAVTDTFFFRIPTFDEIHRAMTRRESDVKERIQASRRQQNELMKNVEQLDKATSESKETPGWDQQQLAEKIESMMKAQADSLQASLEQLEENVKQLRNEGTLGEDIARKMDEIKKAMEELIKQYGDSLLFNRNDRGDITMDDMRQAVEKLKSMLPELSERLDNTLQFLEALKRDRELADLALRSEKLAREQSQLSENPQDQLSAARQKDLLDRINQLKKEIRDASTGNNSDLSESPAMQQVDSLSRSMDEQLSQGQTPSKGTMGQMSASLASMAQQLKEKTNAFRMEQLEALRNKLLDLANGTIGMSQWQEQLHSGLASTEDERRQLAREQQALHEALGHIGRNMDSLPLLGPSPRRQLRSDLSAAQEAAKAAVESMGSGDGSFGMRVSGQMLDRLTGKLLEIASAMSRQNEGSCNNGGGMQESLRKMSGKQAAINAATAQLLHAMMQGRQPGGTTEGGEGEGNEAARKEAQAAQKAIADELKQLGEKFGDATGQGMQERIKQLEKEARDLSRMLNEPREEVTERQDRFLARMLQSALSLHREDEGKEERKSTSAGIVFTGTAGTLSDSAAGAVDAFQLLRRRALGSGNFPPVYRSSINAYFDSLGVLYLKETGVRSQKSE